MVQPRWRDFRRNSNFHFQTQDDDNHMIPYTQLDRQGSKTAIDWDCFIRGLKEIGYEGDLSFETFRGIGMLPRAVRKEGFSLISAIGRYMREEIQG